MILYNEDLDTLRNLSIKHQNEFGQHGSKVIVDEMIKHFESLEKKEFLMNIKMIVTEVMRLYLYSGLAVKKGK